MRKIVLSLSALFILLSLLTINVFAEEIKNKKDKYNYLYTLDYECKPLVAPDGIAVDSNGNLYIINGMFGRVQVYHNNQFLYSYAISSDGTCGGALCIQIDRNDFVYLSLVRSKIGLKFSDNQLVEAVDNYQNYTFYPNKQNNQCYDSCQNKYELHSILGYNYVTKTTIDGKTSTIYTLPILHFLVKLFLVLFFITIFIVNIRIVFKIKKVFYPNNEPPFVPFEEPVCSQQNSLQQEDRQIYTPYNAPVCRHRVSFGSIYFLKPRNYRNCTECGAKIRLRMKYRLLYYTTVLFWAIAVFIVWINSFKLAYIFLLFIYFIMTNSIIYLIYRFGKYEIDESG